MASKDEWTDADEVRRLQDEQAQDEASQSQVLRGFAKEAMKAYEALGERLFSGLAKKDADALDTIAKWLSGAEWNADTCQLIAQVVRGTGRDVKEYQP